MGTKVFMKAPKGTKSASVEGHEYEVPQSGKNAGIIELAIVGHQETLEAHNFTLYEPDPSEADIDTWDEDQLTVFLEQHGEDVDPDASEKKLRKQAKTILAKKAK